IFPTVLNAYITFLERSVNAQFDDERTRFQLFASGDLFCAFGEYVIKPLLKPAAFYALPFLVVLIGKKDRVFAWDYGRSLRQRNHLALHHGFDRACDLYDEFFSL